MKYAAAIVLLIGIYAVAQAEEEACHNNVITACTGSSLLGGPVCTARYGGIDHVESEVQAYINTQLQKSYEYLLLATFFNSYQKNRPGFQKLYQGLSDRSFDATIDLIKQVSRRGGRADFNTVHEDQVTLSRQPKTLEVDELHSLALALDNEKQLAKNAFHVHNEATHATSTLRDPEMAHYFEEKFLTNQAESVRKLSGYVNDLSKLVSVPDPSLAVYLFDEFLQKQ